VVALPTRVRWRDPPQLVRSPDAATSAAGARRADGLAARPPARGPATRAGCSSSSRRGARVAVRGRSRSTAGRGPARERSSARRPPGSARRRDPWGVGAPVDVAGLRVARAQRPARGEAVHRGHRHLQHDEVGQLRRAGLGAAGGGPLRSDTWHFRWRAGASTRPLLRSISMVSERRASAWTRLLRGLGLSTPRTVSRSPARHGAPGTGCTCQPGSTRTRTISAPGSTLWSTAARELGGEPLRPLQQPQPRQRAPAPRQDRWRITSRRPAKDREPAGRAAR